MFNSGTDEGSTSLGATTGMVNLHVWIVNRVRLQSAHFFLVASLLHDLIEECQEVWVLGGQGFLQRRDRNDLSHM